MPSACEMLPRRRGDAHVRGTAGTMVRSFDVHAVANGRAADAAGVRREGERKAAGGLPGSGQSRERWLELQSSLKPEPRAASKEGAPRQAREPFHFLAEGKLVSPPPPKQFCLTGTAAAHRKVL